MNHISKSFFARQSLGFLALVLFAGIVPQLTAQTPPQSAMLALPDSPGTVRTSNTYISESSSAFAEASPAQVRQPVMASRYDTFILPGQQAPSLRAKDKFWMGARDSISPFSIVGWFASAGFAHLVNGSPNYGTDTGAFGQRLGASVIRDATEDIFSTSIMANVFHEDPRYYKLGRGHSIGKRVVYAATRAIITRTDSGRTTLNLALLSGNLAGSILTNAYYPPLNHGFNQTMQTFGSSVGGSALGFGVSEFLSDALIIVHLKKSE